jgi:hypothetical protein
MDEKVYGGRGSFHYTHTHTHTCIYIYTHTDRLIGSQADGQIDR